jgi:hypothetical protein
MLDVFRLQSFQEYKQLDNRKALSNGRYQLMPSFFCNSSSDNPFVSG